MEFTDSASDLIVFYLLCKKYFRSINTTLIAKRLDIYSCTGGQGTQKQGKGLRVLTISTALRVLIGLNGKPVIIRKNLFTSWKIDFHNNYFVISAGFEPTTRSLEGCCSIQLSYETKTGSQSYHKWLNSAKEKRVRNCGERLSWFRNLCGSSHPTPCYRPGSQCCHGLPSKVPWDDRKPVPEKRS